MIEEAQINEPDNEIKTPPESIKTKNKKENSKKRKADELESAGNAFKMEKSKKK